MDRVCVFVCGGGGGFGLYKYCFKSHVSNSVLLFLVVCGGEDNHMYLHKIFPLSPLPGNYFKMLPFLGLPWPSRGEDFAFQCRGCGFDPWSGS